MYFGKRKTWRAAEIANLSSALEVRTDHNHIKDSVKNLYAISHYLICSAPDLRLCVRFGRERAAADGIWKNGTRCANRWVVETCLHGHVWSHFYRNDWYFSGYGFFLSAINMHDESLKLFNGLTEVLTPQQLNPSWLCHLENSVLISWFSFSDSWFRGCCLLLARTGLFAQVQGFCEWAVNELEILKQ